ncbi:hypothetical protein EJB05_19350 [Eragrostis curvula]|uniref:Uncharacterized protein n=1 Tax=Eragrostis curvula TaxID=38414 RepID=A0A5J9UVE8_9POAL|nr:hypothetical protein EJB05_19350 [Eragrostis curvula]
MGKVHGSLARAGKVRGQTPKVAKQDKKKKPRGRAHKRMQYNRRFVTAVVGFGKKRGPNSSENYLERLDMSKRMKISFISAEVYTEENQLQICLGKRAAFYFCFNRRYPGPSVRWWAVHML